MIAHRLTLICYDNATAQSYLKTSQHSILYLLPLAEEYGSFYTSFSYMRTQLQGNTKTDNDQMRVIASCECYGFISS